MKYSIPVFIVIVIFLVGCSYEYARIAFGYGIVVCWQRPSWIRNDFPHPVRVQCHGYRCSFSFLGAATHDYPLKWIIALQPGERKSITINDINASFRVYKDSELVDTLRINSDRVARVDKKLVREKDIKTKEALCDYLGSMADDIRQTQSPGSLTYWPPIGK